MKIYYPSYYKEFKCLADKCSHSCCVGWEIGVDADTMEKYRQLPVSEREEILTHIDGEDCIALSDGRRCPFLNSDGLCRIICEYGDSYTSIICREHPRFYHRVGNRVECGIGASCEEACRIILSSDGWHEFFSVDGVVAPAEETDFDVLSHRDYIYSIILDNGTYGEKLNKIKAEYELTDVDFSADRWNVFFSELEYLNEENRGNFLIVDKSECEELQSCFLRFFAYLIFRHLSVAQSYDGLRARLGFCLLLLRVLESACRDSRFETLCEAARIISEEIEYSEDNTAAIIFEFECMV